MKGKMFTYNGKRMKSWNLFTGCNFNCSYCWARQLAKTRLKASYPNGFIPTTHPDRFNRQFQPDDFVFPISMGDIAFAPSVVVDCILLTAKKHPATNFLLCTKDPSIFHKVVFHQPNIYLGATIETNRHYNLSKAPIPYVRASAMRDISHPHKFIAIEPIMDFDIEFISWLARIQPSIIEVGADNYHNNLPEPNADKVNALLDFLKDICPVVVEKQGLERLK